MGEDILVHSFMVIGELLTIWVSITGMANVTEGYKAPVYLLISFYFLTRPRGMWDLSSPIRD